MNTQLLSHSSRSVRAVSGFARAAVALVLLQLAAACDAPLSTRPQAAYNPTALTSGLYYHWTGGSIVTVAVVGTDTGLSGAVERAITQWNAIPQYGEFVLTRVSTAATANIIVYDAIGANPTQPAADCAYDPHGAGGYTYFCPAVEVTPGGTPTVAARLPLLAGDGIATVVIRVDRGRAPTAAKYDALVAHEFGHALGIGAHSDLLDDLMFSNPTATKPTARDQATLRFVLGKAPDIRL